MSRAALVIVLAACHTAGSSGDDDTAAASTGAATGGGSGSEGSSGSDTGEFACDDVPVITYDTFGAGFLATYCNGCHGALVVDRKGAPPDVVFETRADAAMFADRILARRMPPAGTIPMPPAGGVTPGDDERLRIWLTCFP